MSKQRKIGLALLVVLTAGAWWTLKSHPKIEGFSDESHVWNSYGGAWELKSGTMRNSSDERGAKLLTGSRYWQNYSVEADVALLESYGDAGLVVRARDPEEGVDSYAGYFAGLRTLDNTLILGRADYGWEEYMANPIPGNLQIQRFYHLHVITVGCSIAVRVDLPGGGSIRQGVELQHCVEKGQIGLKSYQTPALWKNFRVSAATRADLDQMMEGVPLASAEKGTLHRYSDPVNDMEPIQTDALNHKVDGSVTTVEQLRLLPPNSTTQASVRGVVRLLSPMTYVEDSSGGIAIASHDAPALAIGNDVEMSGVVSMSTGQLVMSRAHVKILWSNTPTTAPLITADQAATGSEDGRFVVLDGHLLRTWKLARQVIMELESGGEIYRAIVEENRYDRKLTTIALGSELQLTGVIRSDPAFAGDSAFALLLSPTQGAVRVLHEAPWWTPVHITYVSIASLSIVVTMLLLYQRFRQRYLMHIVEERELLAHDLHDTVAQSFAGIGFQLRAVQNLLPADASPRPQLERAQSMVRESHEELRKSITSLRADIGSISEVASALESSALHLVQGGNLSIDCTCRGTPRRLPLRIADCYFRIGQEAIANAVLHAEASRLSIQLYHETKLLVLQVTDNGHGLRRENRSPGSGLYGMAKRAEMIGAQLEVKTGPEGTTVLLKRHLSATAATIWTPVLSRIGVMIKPTA